MSEETKKAQAKNYNDYGYIGDEEITMSVQEFIAMRKAIEKGLNNGTNGKLPQKLTWYDTKKGQRVVNPTSKQLNSGDLKQFADTEATFSEDNVDIYYDADVYPEIFQGMQIGMQIHNRMVDTGVAKPAEEIKKAYEERKAKGQMKVVDEDETVEVQVEDAPEDVPEDTPESKE